MSDFTSEFWNWFIIVPTILGILACFWLIRWMGKGIIKAEGETEDTGHVWDGDLKELNNPLPRWWLGLFYITLFFSIAYLALYPGLGTFKGLLGWTSTGAYEEEMQTADERYGPLFRQFQSQDLITVSHSAKAKKIGERLFLNHCSTCHGSDARGARGFPNLRDNDWLWGGSPEKIKQTIADGRTGVMPGWEDILGSEKEVADVTEFVISLSDRTHNSEAALRGKDKFFTFCTGCHGAEGKGNPILGAPNLADNTWLHGGSRLKITESIRIGRQGHMPPHRDFLGDAKVHLLAAYIYGLSGEKP